jgi:hypothetical protein
MDRLPASLLSLPRFIAFRAVQIFREILSAKYFKTDSSLISFRAIPHIETTVSNALAPIEQTIYDVSS